MRKGYRSFSLFKNNALCSIKYGNTHIVRVVVARNAVEERRVIVATIEFVLPATRIKLGRI